MRAWDPFSWVKRPKRGAVHSLLSSTEDKVEPYLQGPTPHRNSDYTVSKRLHGSEQRAGETWNYIDISAGGLTENYTIISNDDSGFHEG